MFKSNMVLHVNYKTKHKHRKEMIKHIDIINANRLHNSVELYEYLYNVIKNTDDLSVHDFDFILSNTVWIPWR